MSLGSEEINKGKGTTGKVNEIEDSDKITGKWKVTVRSLKCNIGSS
jgi:hypothetical protein